MTHEVIAWMGWGAVALAFGWVCTSLVQHWLAMRKLRALQAVELRSLAREEFRVMGTVRNATPEQREIVRAVLRKPPGEVFTAKQLADQLNAHRAKMPVRKVALADDDNEQTSFYKPSADVLSIIDAAPSYESHSSHHSHHDSGSHFEGGGGHSGGGGASGSWGDDSPSFDSVGSDSGGGFDGGGGSSD